MSRTNNAIKNAYVNALFFTLQIIITFISRKIFLNILGIKFVGVNATILSIIGFLNLAELGISMAISVLLYKPLLNRNWVEVNEILLVLKIYYKRIGNFLFIIGLILSLFLGKIFANSSYSISYVYIGYFSYLFSTLILYYKNSNQVLLTADQKNYIVVKNYNLLMAIKQIFQITITLIFKSPLIWFLLELPTGIIYSIILNRKIIKQYPFISTINISYDTIKSKYTHINKTLRNLFVHKISGFVASQLSQLIIFTLINVSMVGLFNNYYIIINRVQGIVYNVLGVSFSASIGNLIAEDNRSKANSIFWELFSFRFLISSTIAVVIYCNLPLLITLWLGKNYLLDNYSVFLLLLSTFIMMIRGTVDDFINSYGLFSDVWAPITEMIINISVSIYYGYRYGLSGILLGNVVSMSIIVMIWKPYYLYSRGFIMNPIKYFSLFLKYIIISGALMYFVYLTLNKLYNLCPTNPYLTLLILLFSCIILYPVLFSLIMYFVADEYKRMLRRGVNILKSRLLNE